MRQKLERIHYREILLKELLRKKRINPAFSLRAFAGQLKVAPSTLSDVLSGKQGLSGKLAARISDSLCLAVDQKHAFVQSACRDETQSQTKRDNAEKDYLKLELDQFQAISQWYHHAIIGLSMVRPNRSDSRWIAKRLGIANSVAKAAFKRLCELGILEKQGRSFVQASAGFKTDESEFSSAIQEYYHQNLKLAGDSIDRDSLSERSMGVLMVGVDLDNLKKAKKEIVKFRRRMAKLLSDGKPERVYSLAVQLFPVDKVKLKEKIK